MACLPGMAGKQDPSGVVVHPRLPVPSKRASEPRLSGGDDGRRRKALLIGGLVLAIGGGSAAGYFLAPTKDKELSAARTELAAAKTAAKVEADRADGAKKQLEVITKDKTELEKKYADASSRLAENEKKAAEENAAAHKKLETALTTSGEVSTEGEEIRLKLVDKVLFEPGDDQLTDKGKAVLAKVGKALADLPDKQIWVQGHTDDEPIPVAPAPKKASSSKKKKKKGAKPEPVATDAGPRFASNWELSAARALQVVHYLQDVAKIEPSRLAALAFGQYRPVSKTNKAKNRRIEIVLYPHRAVIEPVKRKKK